MGVITLNHPFIDGFSLINQLLGYFWTPQFFSRFPHPNVAYRRGSMGDAVLETQKDHAF